MKYIYLTIIALLLAALSGCSSGSDTDTSGKKLLVASVEPESAILSEIAGNGYEIVTLMSAGSNPETFEPTVKTRMNIEKADAFFSIGTMPFEKKLEQSLPSTIKIINTSMGIQPIYGTHSHHHDHHGDDHDHDSGHHESDVDPHTWVSVRNARIMASNMHDALIGLYPGKKDVFDRNYRRLDQRLDSIDRVISGKLQSDGATQAFAVWHPSLSYFARDYGLKQVSVGFENKEMSPLRIAQARNEALENRVKVFFFQKEYDTRQFESLNDGIGAKLVPVNLMSADWEAELLKIANELSLAQ